MKPSTEQSPMRWEYRVAEPQPYVYTVEQYRPQERGWWLWKREVWEWTALDRFGGPATNDGVKIIHHYSSHELAMAAIARFRKGSAHV